MAWPPPVQPTNRTNATPQLDTHAADHNALALAVNDLVTEVGRGRGEYPTTFNFDAGSKAPGTYTIYQSPVVAAPAAVRVTVWGTMVWGFSGGACTVQTGIRPNLYVSVGQVQNDQEQAPPGQFNSSSLAYSWTVGAGADMSFTTWVTVGTANAYCRSTGMYLIQRI